MSTSPATVTPIFGNTAVLRSGPLRVVTMGARAGAHVHALVDGHFGLELVRQFAFDADLRREEDELECDLLIVHVSHLRPGFEARLQELRARLDPAHVVVVYETSRIALARSLRDASTSVLKGFSHLGQFIDVWLPEQAVAA